MAAERFRQVFQRPGVRVWVLFDGHEWAVELAVQSSGDYFYNRAIVELSLQPRGADGLAMGHAIPLWSAEIPLIRFPTRDWCWGRESLGTAINHELATMCHVRATPLGEATAADMSPHMENDS